MKETKGDLQELSLDDLINRFDEMYMAEIFENKLGTVFRKSFDQKMTAEQTRERLLDKKFAHHFLLELKKLNYDMAVPYGSFYKSNTQPPLSSSNSRLSAVLVYSKSQPDLAPIVLELGNRIQDTLVINETIVSSTSRKIDASQKAANFIPLLKPGDEKFRVNFDEGKQTCVGQIPAAIQKKTYFAAERENTAKMVETALAKARETLPDEMKKAEGDGYTVRTVDETIDAFSLDTSTPKPE